MGYTHRYHEKPLWGYWDERTIGFEAEGPVNYQLSIVAKATLG